jgi:hypothetical protein
VTTFVAVLLHFRIDAVGPPAVEPSTPPAESGLPA